ncbi:histone deacetylase family protein, partial [Nanoarchaeota archaeon]
MKIIFSPKCLEYEQVGHPESSERVRKSCEFLKKKDFEFVEADLVKEEDILRVHSKEHLESVRKGDFFNLDSPVYENVFYYVGLSAGAAVKAMEIALNGENSFSLLRPPGHHAFDRPEGFCYFNNLAIAVAKALELDKKVAIVDFDLHHGNGTQNIFLGKENVLFVSLHRLGIYPGTGETSEKNCYNFGFLKSVVGEEYLETLKKSLEIVKKFNPDLIAVSAGFDSYKDSE